MQGAGSTELANVVERNIKALLAHRQEEEGSRGAVPRHLRPDHPELAELSQDVAPEKVIEKMEAQKRAHEPKRR